MPMAPRCSPSMSLVSPIVVQQVQAQPVLAALDRLTEEVARLSQAVARLDPDYAGASLEEARARHPRLFARAWWVR